MKTKVITQEERSKLDQLVRGCCDELKSKLSNISFVSIFTDPVNEMPTAIIGYHE